MLMGQSLEEFLSSLVSYGDLTRRQKRTIIKLSDDSPSVSGGLFGVATPDEAPIEAVESTDSLTLNRGALIIGLVCERNLNSDMMD